ncbi:Uncharacterised protein [uncultured archaeon]|nr:Uncharacterised protein [uncultured archaeon]
MKNLASLMLFGKPPTDKSSALSAIMQYVGDDNEDDNTIFLDTYGYPEINEHDIRKGNVEICLGWFMPHDPATEAAWYLITNISVPNYEKYHKQYLKRQKIIEQMLTKETEKVKLNAKEMRVLRRIAESKVKKPRLPKICNEIVLHDLNSNFDYNFRTKIRDFGYWQEPPAYDRNHGAKPYWIYADHHVDKRAVIRHYLKNLPYRTRRNADMWLSRKSRVYRRIQYWRRDREMKALFDPNSKKNRKIREQAERKWTE